MIRPASGALKRLCTSLCLLLAFVFAASTMTNVIDRFQHAPGQAAHHVHSSISVVTLAFEDGHEVDHHDADHRNGDRTDDSSPGQQTGHHHHADGTSGLPVLAASDQGMAFAEATLLRARPAPLLLGLTLHGPERPPKADIRIA